MPTLVFVTVGNGREPFRRLLEPIDRLAGEGFFTPAQVLVQSGNDGGFRAKHCEQVRFMPMHNFADTVSKAALVIAHAGAGTLFHLLQVGKVPVIMPRRRAFAECVDDHQLELAEALAREGRVVAAMTAEDLPAAVAHARQRTGKPGPGSPPRMFVLVEQAIAELMSR